MIDFSIGDTVADYEIVGVLGAGGMGKVFRVRNIITDRFEAMKVLLPDLAGDPEIGDRFLREIKVHASLRHPNIAGMHGAQRYRGSYLMFIELVDGQSLDQVIAAGPVASATGIDLMWHVLSALSYAHQHGVVHRDIKPSNILLQSDGTVKVTDFGIARSAVASQLTATGSVLGSIYYISPEQVKALPVDARSDLYSVGITLYEVLTRVRPFEGASEYAIMQGHLERTPALPHELAPHLPPELSAVVLKALGKTPEDRFQTAAEFQEALEPFRGRHTPRLSTFPATRLSPQPTFSPISPVQPPPAPPQTPVPTLSEELTVIQAKLTPFLGPIASRLVSKVAREHSTRAEIVRALAQHISDPLEREAFLKACPPGGRLSDPASRAPKTPTPGVKEPTRASWDPSRIELLKQKLTLHIGPVANVLVDRTSKKATSWRQLCETLANEIASEKDRAAFLRSLPH